MTIETLTITHQPSFYRLSENFNFVFKMKRLCVFVFVCDTSYAIGGDVVKHLNEPTLNHIYCTIHIWMLLLERSHSSFARSIPIRFDGIPCQEVSSPSYFYMGVLNKYQIIVRKRERANSQPANNNAIKMKSPINRKRSHETTLIISNVVAT